MAGELTQFFVRLGTVFDDKGFKEAAAGVKGIETKIDALTGIMGQLGMAVSAGAAIYGIIGFAKSSIDAFAEQERATNRLRGAMQNLGSYSKDALDDQLAFAQGLQRTTTYTDDEIIEAQTLLTTYGLYGDKLKEVTKAAMDLASRKGIDLHAATMMLGKAFDGETGRLKLLGIHFQETGSKTQNFAQVLHEVQRMSGGAASAEMDTYAGKVRNLGNRFDDLKKQFGELLVGPATKVLEWGSKMAGAMESLFPTTELGKAKKELAGVTALLNSSPTLIETVKGTTIGWLTQLVSGKNIISDKNELLKIQAMLIAKIAALEKAGVKSKPRPPALGDDITDEGSARLQADAKVRIETEGTQRSLLLQADMYGAADADREMFQANSLASQLKMQAAFEDDVVKKHRLSTASMNVLDKARNQTMINGAAQALSFIAGAWGEHTAMYKATAISLAIINTYQAYTAALAIPFIGWALAPVVLASGLAMVAKIAGVKLAQGGLALARAGGTRAVIGEAGSDEAVLPLSDRGAMDRIARAILGGRGGMALAGGYGPITVNQVFNMASAGQGVAGGVTALIEEIRIATRDGVVEALDMAKQIVRTGAALENEA